MRLLLQENWRMAANRPCNGYDTRVQCVGAVQQSYDGQKLKLPHFRCVDPLARLVFIASGRRDAAMQMQFARKTPASGLHNLGGVRSRATARRDICIL